MILQKSLESFDAIIIGQFNIINRPMDLKHIFYTDMKNVQEKLPKDYLVDYTTKRTPSVVDVAESINNHIPLVATSMFSKQYKGRFLKDCERMKSLTGNSNRTAMSKDRAPPFLCLDLGTYVKDIGLGSSENRYNISDTSRDSPNALRAHRCVGPRGGHPDIVAWDLTEFLYEHA